MALKAESVAKKKTPRMVVMITTMIAVVTVSLRLGQTTFAVSARTCRRTSPGLTLAKVSNPQNNTNQAKD